MSKTITPTAPAKVAAPRIDNEIVETLIQMLRLKNHRICQHSFQVAKDKTVTKEMLELTE